MPKRISSDGEVVYKTEKNFVSRTNKCLQKWLAFLGLILGLLVFVVFALLPLIYAGLYKAIPFVESVCTTCTSIMMWMVKQVSGKENKEAFMEWLKDNAYLFSLALVKTEAPATTIGNETTL